MAYSYQRIELRLFPNCAHSPQSEKLDDFIAGIYSITEGSEHEIFLFPSYALQRC